MVDDLGILGTWQRPVDPGQFTAFSIQHKLSSLPEITTDTLYKEANMLWRRVLPMIFLGTLAAVAQSGGVSEKKAVTAAAKISTPAAAASAETTVAKPKSFDLRAMDKTVAPCEDFY